MKVCIVEDDEAIRIVMKRLLKKKFSAITEIGECDSAEKALRDIPPFAPDIILVDITLPGMDGIELIIKLRPHCPKAGILVLTGHEIDRFEQTALDAGANGIVSKMDHERLLSFVKKLLARGSLK
jgi:DNA-binding NarL/FixJ family response regulator